MDRMERWRDGEMQRWRDGEIERGERREEKWLVEKRNNEELEILKK